MFHSVVFLFVLHLLLLFMTNDDAAVVVGVYLGFCFSGDLFFVFGLR